MKKGIFARFDLENSQIMFHKWSENTEILMPSLNYIRRS